MTAYRLRRLVCKLKQNANEGCNSRESLAGLVSCFIASFILLVIAPLGSSPFYAAVWTKPWTRPACCITGSHRWTCECSDLVAEMCGVAWRRLAGLGALMMMMNWLVAAVHQSITAEHTATTSSSISTNSSSSSSRSIAVSRDAETN